jgi:pyruvate-formate lyase
MVRIALHYDQGNGVEKDPREAASWLVKSLERHTKNTIKNVGSGARNWHNDTRIEFQRALHARGYFNGDTDGIFGFETTMAAQKLFDAARLSENNA